MKDGTWKVQLDAVRERTGEVEAEGSGAWAETTNREESRMEAIVGSWRAGLEVAAKFCSVAESGGWEIESLCLVPGRE